MMNYWGERRRVQLYCKDNKGRLDENRRGGIVMNSTEASKQDEDTCTQSMLHEGAEAGKVESEAKVSALGFVSEMRAPQGFYGFTQEKKLSAPP